LGSIILFQKYNLWNEGFYKLRLFQKPFNMGYLAVKAAIAAVNKISRSVYRYGSVLITPNNMYLPENQKLLFPFIE
jgi:ribose transport system substrate-binding protein